MNTGKGTRMIQIIYIKTEDLEQLARRVWYAKRDKAGRVNVCGEKHASFEAMGYPTMSTEFPYGMRQGDWISAGELEISYSHGKWDIPGYIRVRKAQ